MSSQPGAPRLSPLEPPLSPLPVGAAQPPPAPAPLLRAAPEPVTAPPPPQVSLEAQLLRFRLVTPDQMSEAMRIEAETGMPVAEIVVERGWVSRDDLAKVTASTEPAAPAAVEPAVPAAPEPPPTPAAQAPVRDSGPVEGVPGEPGGSPVPNAAPVAATPPAPAPIAPPPPPEPEPEPELPPAAVVPEPAVVPPPASAPAPVAAGLEPPPPPASAPEQPTPTPPPPAPAPAAPPPRPAEPAAAALIRVMVRLRSGELLEGGSYDDAQAARERAKELVGSLQAEDAWPFVAGRYVAPEEIDSIFLEKR